MFIFRAECEIKKSIFSYRNERFYNINLSVIYKHHNEEHNTYKSMQQSALKTVNKLLFISATILT